MPIEKKYIFSASYKNQLMSVLQKGSLAFDVYIDKSNVEIMVSSVLLPRHCELKLIEEVLANLEKSPDNTELLDALGKYTKNNFFERMGYWGMLGGTVGVGIGGVLLLGIMASPLMLASAIAFLAPSIIVAASIFFILNKYVCQGYLGLKLGRLISDFVKGPKATQQELVELKELEGNLNALIKRDESKEIATEPVKGSVLISQSNVKDSMSVLQGSEESAKVESSPFYAGDFSDHLFLFEKNKLDDRFENLAVDTNGNYYKSI